MKPAIREYHDGVVLVKLSRGVTNAVNLELIEYLSRILEEIRMENEVKGFVLASSNEKFFSIGLDIPDLYDLSRDEFTVFYRKFNQLCLDLYTIPKPAIAAITGHATAAGCIFALCFDYRFMAEGKKVMGLNEIKLGVPVPYPADCILQQLTGYRNARDIVDTGGFYSPEDALGLGLVDRVVPIHDVLDTSLEKARELGSFHSSAFAMIKRNRVETVLARIHRHLEEREQYFVDCWYRESTRERLRQAIEIF